MSSSRHNRSRSHRQQGAVLLLSLIVLVVLLAAGAALVRSFATTQSAAGNIAFKRDLLNQAERAVPGIMTELKTGLLAAPADRAANREVGINYSPTIIETTPQGIPNALLLGDAAFDALPFASSANDIEYDDERITIRYVVDRLALAAVQDCALGDRYVSGDSGVPKGGSGSLIGRRADSVSVAPVDPDLAPGVTPDPCAGGTPVAPQIVYRLSMRVTGPRDTQAFLQTTMTR